MTRRFVFCAVAAFVAVPPVAAEEFFRPGDRVLFLGDSITEQYQYSSYIELYLTTRFPTAGMSFYNAGIGGDRAVGGMRRFADHVLAEKPTALTINFGMNDGGYGGFDKAKNDEYVKNTDGMVAAAKKAGVRVALISPNAVEVRSRPNLAQYLETQKEFYAPLKEIAARNGVPFVDQYAVTRRALEKMAADKAAVKPFPDGVHTNPAGGLLMAHTILTGLGAPASVSEVSIDAAGKASTKNCTVAKVMTTPTGLSFERTDDALPMPVLKEWRDLIPYVNGLKDLNHYGLTVAGLPAGRFALSIDRTEVGQFTAAELAAGVNLGLLDKGPLFDQGMKVYEAITAKNRIVHQRFRGVRMAQVPEWLAEAAKELRPKELAKRAEQIATRQAEVYSLAKPTTHRFELKSIP